MILSLLAGIAVAGCCDLSEGQTTEAMGGPLRDKLAERLDRQEINHKAEIEATRILFDGRIADLAKSVKQGRIESQKSKTEIRTLRERIQQGLEERQKLKKEGQLLRQQIVSGEAKLAKRFLWFAIFISTGASIIVFTALWLLSKVATAWNRGLSNILGG